eukprot:CAMPEP_0172164412 /NCGR_PEP_ID=MMETSP1050-20130122/7832_1 /TAXON_ID=233186 /ORGANISM="Cryptomonas curvata, Strain CCAP979/52" /LENGTH=147 /DNA_ID=CAMNT_0012834749 /DNA_START=1500 /DNA_END=1947 /DNA_ORIENTATION=-
MPPQHLVLAEEDEQAHEDEVNALEDDGVLLGVLGHVGHEVGRKLGPVPLGVHVVLHMVAVVEGPLVEIGVDHIVGEMVVTPRLGRVDEDMLRPVAKHEKKRACEGGKAENQNAPHGLSLDRKNNATQKEAIATAAPAAILYRLRFHA